MNRLYLVRHGENPANVNRQFSHRKIDFTLNAKGILQARQTAAYFRGKPIHEIYASPLKRTIQTAQIIADEVGLPFQVLENFRELNVGDLEGRPTSEKIWARHDAILAAWAGGNPDVQFPGGEDYHTLWNRYRSGIEQIVAGKTDRNIIIAGHASLFTCTLHDLCPHIDPATIEFKHIRNCSITQVDVEWVDGRLCGHLVEWSYSGHLSGAAAEPATYMPFEE